MMMEEGVDVEAFYVHVKFTLFCESQSTVPRGPPRLTYKRKIYTHLFIGPLRGKNIVLSLHLKWVPTFIAIFFLLLNSHVRMCVRCTVKYLFGSFSGSSNLSPKLR